MKTLFNGFWQRLPLIKWFSLAPAVLALVMSGATTARAQTWKQDGTVLTRGNDCYISPNGGGSESFGDKNITAAAEFYDLVGEPLESADVTANIAFNFHTIEDPPITGGILPVTASAEVSGSVTPAPGATAPASASSNAAYDFGANAGGQTNPNQSYDVPINGQPSAGPINTGGANTFIVNATLRAHVKCGPAPDPLEGVEGVQAAHQSTGYANASADLVLANNGVGYPNGGA